MLREASTHIMIEPKEDKKLPKSFKSRQEMGRYGRQKAIEKQQRDKEDAEKYRKLMEVKK